MRRLPSSLTLLVGCALLGAPAALATGPLPDRSRHWPVERRLAEITPAADSVWNRSREGASDYCDSLIRSARASRDRTLRTAVHLWRGRKLANFYRIDEAKPDLDTAWTLALALRDSAGLARVLAARAHGANVMGRLAETRREYERVVPLARAAGLPGILGFAHRGLGFIAKEDGRYADARRHLGEAVRLLPRDRFESRHTRFLLAEVENRVGRHDEARDTFLVLLDEARIRRDRWTEAATLNDLGNLEFLGGDASLADRYWEYAAAAFDSAENRASAISARVNRAHALRSIGRLDEARALLERLRTDAEREGNPGVLLAVLGEQALLQRRLGRSAEAERIYRALRAAAVDDALIREGSALDLAALLRETGRAAESERLMDSLLAPGARAKLSRDDLHAARVERSAARRAQGRAREALPEARAAERGARAAREASPFALEAALELARCHRALGAPDSAVAVLGRAVRQWERWRGGVSDFEWRERMGASLSSLFAEYGLALLDPGRGGTSARRAREAFDALQTFQARTLEERLAGRGLAGAGMRGRVTADSLRRGVLREGELLLDVVATDDTTFLFLVSRGGIGARLLPAAPRLERLHAAWREAALAGAADDVVAAGLGRLAAELLGPAAAAIRPSRAVILSGGGPVALWPLAALAPPGETAPLGESREVSTVPSATLLAALRAAARAPGGPRGLLALGRTTDARGRELPGVGRELRALRDGFGAEVRANGGELDVAELIADLPRWGVLHFAAHAEAVSGSPWRSGFLLGRGAGDGAYLRASRIAGMKLRARLAVLSGCQSAGATTLSGEGALGLAGAFLCSGTSSVVATLWPVEDRVAERFMAEFYAALARGATVAGAVGEAQGRLRARRETAQVRNWAAFAASGEGGVRVPVGRRLTPGPEDRLNR